MRAWQWSAVPLAIGLFLCIVAYPFTHYADIDVDREQSVAAEKGTTSRLFKGWKNGFLPIDEIKRLNNYEINGTPIKLSSGGNAQPNWLVVLLLIACTALLCGLILGHRPPIFSARRKLLLEACGGFVLLGLAGVEIARLQIDGFSWMLVILSVIASLGGLFLLWESVSARSAEVEDANREAT
jgi:hypothetical protein